MVPRDGGHVLYVEQVGKPDGLPVVFLHGGPGSGCQPAHRQLFDPKRFRAILWDQRGAGRSTPKGSRTANTTQHLLADLEHIRTLLKIDRWLVVGGSWGATLAIAYAEAHPERVRGLSLRGVFLGAPEEWRWAFVDAPRIFRPDLHQVLLALLPESERTDLIGALTRRLFHLDAAIHQPAAVAWGEYERVLSEVHAAPPAPLPASLSAPLGGRSIPNTPYIEAHYCAHDSFLRPRQLLDDAHRLRGIPGILVQGRYDMLCPPQVAQSLHHAWPGSELRIVEMAGHAISEPGIRPAVIQAIEDVADRAG